MDRTLPEATNDPGQANLPPPPTIPQATAPPRLASDSALWPKKPQLLTRRERDDLLQATGDFFSELLTEAEAAEVRALEEQVRESQTLMAKAHEMAASTRRGFHTALEAVLSRSRDEAPDDELRSLLPSPPKAPVQAPSRPPWPGQRPGTAHGPTGNPWQPPSGSGASARPCGVFPKEPWP